MVNSRSLDPVLMLHLFLLARFDALYFKNNFI